MQYQSPRNEEKEQTLSKEKNLFSHPFRLGKQLVKNFCLFGGNRK
jgi:hypothetical protein